MFYENEQIAQQWLIQVIQTLEELLIFFVQRNIVDNQLIVDTESLVQNDYKLQVLEILQTQDKKIF